MAPSSTPPNSRGSARVRSGNTPGRSGLARGTVPRAYLGGSRTGSERTGPRPDVARGRARPRAGGGGPRDPGGPGRGGGGGGGGRGPRRARPRWRRIALVCVLAVALLAGVAGVGSWLYAKSLDGDLARTDAFAGLTGGRPAKTVDGVQNILMMGSDSRNPKSNKGWRPDTIMLLHVDADHQHAYVISIPRDTYVYVPAMKGADNGDTHAKINAAFSWGGTPLMVKTVEGFTGVRVDHVAIINFQGFKDVTDALGGVRMYVDQTITSIHPPHRTFTKGWHDFNGAQALDYCRQRYQFPNGDFTREKHQQQFLKDLMKKASSTGTLTNPGKLNSFLHAVTKAVIVDKGFHLVDMAVQFRNLRADDVTFLTSPHEGSQNVDGQSVVVSNKRLASSLYEAVGSDKVGAWLKQHPQK